MKNALAVKTVKAHGVTLIDDLYTTVTDVCGKGLDKARDRVMKPHPFSFTLRFSAWNGNDSAKILDCPLIGKVYKNCLLCDDESKLHPQGKCGAHYSPAGWRLLSNQTAAHIRHAMVARGDAQ
jgi:hypothetical protein